MIDTEEMAAEYLLKISKVLSTTCPPASRFYISNLEKKRSENLDLLKDKDMPQYCRHCGSIWKSKNFKIHTESCQRKNNHIKKLLKMERNEIWKLNNQQKRKLRKFYNSNSKIIYKCLICQKVSSFPGSKSNSSSSSSKVNAASTPVPKILKLNKSEVNAGLFIQSPNITNLNEKNNLDKSDSSIFESSLSSTSDSFSNNLNKLPKYESSFSTVSSSKKQSSVKRKKTLLTQILDQEQSKKKKKDLSSFLVSL